MGECRDINLPAGGSGACDERIPWARVCSNGPLCFAASPIASKRDRVGFASDLEHFGSLPERFDGHGLDVFVVVRDRSVGGIAPNPAFERPAFGRVVCAAGVDNQCVLGRIDLDSHPDRREMTHSQNGHAAPPQIGTARS